MLPLRKFYLFLLFSVILVPIIFSLFILFFQAPVEFFKKRIIKKAKRKRDKFKNLLVIGISGSYGKSSVKEFLSTILSEKFNVLKTEKNINAEIGIAQTILNKLNENHQVFVCEIGAYERGKIKQVCGFVKPKIGILTGINSQHLSTFGSLENIIKAKFEIIESLPENGVGILNWDNEYIKFKVQDSKFKVKVKSLKFYSVKDRLNVWARNVKVERGRISFKVFSRDGDFADFKVNVLGGHNVLNVLGAVAAAKELGMNLNEISNACRKIKIEQGAIKLLKGINGLNIIDSSYSANPEGVIADLDYLNLWQDPEGVRRYYGGPYGASPKGEPSASYGARKKIVIMRCLIELGKSAKDVHKKIGKKISEVCDLAIITTKDYFKELKDSAIENGMNPESILLIKDAKQIAEKIKQFTNPGDTILLEGKTKKQLIDLLIYERNNYERNNR